MDGMILQCILLLVAISIISGMVGPFIIWRHMACFTDTIAHSMVFASLFSILLDLPNIIVGFVISSVLSVMISNIITHSTNTLLTIINSITFALSMILISVFPTVGMQISSLLFGDILLATKNDIIIIYVLSFATTLITCFRWKTWLMMVVSEDIAKVEGVNTNWIKIEFMLVVSMFISIITQMMGALLISALIVIPATSARIIANSPVQTVIFAILICLISSLIGLFFSFELDITTSATIVTSSILTFILIYLLSLIKNKI